MAFTVKQGETYKVKRIRTGESQRGTWCLVVLCDEKNVTTTISTFIDNANESGLIPYAPYDSKGSDPLYATVTKFCDSVSVKRNRPTDGGQNWGADYSFGGVEMVVAKAKTDGFPVPAAVEEALGDGDNPFVPTEDYGLPF